MSEKTIKTVLRAPLVEFWPLVHPLPDEPRDLARAVEKAVDNYLDLVGEGLVLREDIRQTDPKFDGHRDVYQFLTTTRRIARIEGTLIHVFDETIKEPRPPQRSPLV